MLGDMFFEFHLQIPRFLLHEQVRGMPDSFRGHNLVKKMIAALVSNPAGNFLLVAFIMTANRLLFCYNAYYCFGESVMYKISLSLSLDLGNLLLSLLRSATQ